MTATGTTTATTDLRAPHRRRVDGPRLLSCRDRGQRRRDGGARGGGRRLRGALGSGRAEDPGRRRRGDGTRHRAARGGRRDHHGTRRRPRGGGERSEEHTSELQSRENLVCRLLLEKKKRTEKYAPSGITRE